MLVDVIMPSLGEEVHEGVLVNWLVASGDRVETGDRLAEVETDKAIAEITCCDSGVVTELVVTAGETVKAGQILARIDVDRAAAERCEAVRGSRPEFQAEDPAGDRKRNAGGKKKSLKVRRIMARKMTEGWTTIPHFYVTYAIDMTDVIRFRKDLGVTINDFVLAAAARTLAEHPWVNSWWVDGEAVEKQQVNIAMAVATDRGLYNPVLRDCARMSLKEISARAREMAGRAHANRLAPEDLEDGTFTVTNMGMLGVESFRAIITPPQAAVLAVGTVRGEVVVDESGEPAVAPVARMTLAADHRILDGADAADFMLTLKSYLEAPVTLVSCDYGEEN